MRKDSSRFSYTKYGLFEVAMLVVAPELFWGNGSVRAFIVHSRCRDDNSKCVRDPARKNSR